MSEPAPVVLFYDVATDEQRPITQADADAFSRFIGWHLEMREIVMTLTGPGANRRFSRDTLARIKGILDACN